MCFDLGQFIDALAKVEGKFIAVLNPTPENVAAFKKVGHVFRLKVREASGRGGAKHAMRLFVANFPVRKAADFELVAKCEHLPLDPSVERWGTQISLTAERNTRPWAWPDPTEAGDPQGR